MASLSANEASFIAMMLKSDEHARKGFELILKRSDFLRFFDALIAEGLFKPANNPAPVPVQPEGSVQIPYWTALDYLVACAKDTRPYTATISSWPPRPTPFSRLSSPKGNDREP